MLLAGKTRQSVPGTSAATAGDVIPTTTIAGISQVLLSLRIVEAFGTASSSRLVLILPAGHHGSDHETDDAQDEAEDEPPAEASALSLPDQSGDQAEEQTGDQRVDE
jgi:hypothetical protein